MCAPKAKSPAGELGLVRDSVGAAYLIRTGHLMITNQLLYQMS
jgi:hypothetical protein